MGNKYLPLKLLASIRDLDREFVGKYKEMQIRGCIGNDVTVEEYLSYIITKKYVYASYGKFGEKASRFVAENFVMTKSKLPADANLDPEIELLNNFCMKEILEQWGDFSKRVYKPETEFFAELIKTEELKLSSSSLTYLPTRSMYFDFSESKQYVYPFTGAFVYVVDDSISGSQIVVYMITDDGIIFPFYSNFRYDKDGVCTIGDDLMPNTAFKAYMLMDNQETAEVNFTDDNRKMLVIACLQLLAFLSCDGKDLSESPVTKKTYRPSKVIRDKFSEIRMWDVGVRYGQAISAAKAAVLVQDKSNASDADSVKEQMENAPDESVSRKMRMRPRPHIRNAHWQRYHVGKGRSEIRINWVPPVFVCGGKNIPITIHNMTK